MRKAARSILFLLHFLICLSIALPLFFVGACFSYVVVWMACGLEEANEFWGDLW